MRKLGAGGRSSTVSAGRLLLRTVFAVDAIGEASIIGSASTRARQHLPSYTAFYTNLRALCCGLFLPFSKSNRIVASRSLGCELRGERSRPSLSEAVESS